MIDRNFEIGTQKFKLCKIDAFSQFHIVRRMAPMFEELLPAMGKMAAAAKAMEGLSEAERFEESVKVFIPVMNGISKLSDEDANRVLFGLLASVEIQQSTGNWARIATPTSLMFQDLDLPTLMQAAGRAFVFNLSSFFSAPPHSS